MAIHQVLIAGKWQDSGSTGTFQATDPKTKQVIQDQYPVSNWADCEAAMQAATAAFESLRQMPRESIAKFLETFAERLEARSEEIRAMAALETALPADTRLNGEMGRTVGQLKQAANAVQSSNWCQPVIDTTNNVRSCFAAIGPVVVFGPNNFPLAFSSISGGDFAAAIAAGNPVIAKGHPLHPGTMRLVAEEAQRAADETGMPAGMVQLIYHMSNEDGVKMVKDSRVKAVAFTGSRNGGLALKAVADSVGTPIYLELSSVNPIVVLPGALAERSEEIATELTGSCLMGTGQFCTNPGLILVQAGEAAESFIGSLGEKFTAAPVGTLFSQSGEDGLDAAIKQLISAGAQVVCGASTGGGDGFSHSNTVLRATGELFLSKSEALQTEAFGGSTLIVCYDSIEQADQIIRTLEGNLTGCVYSATDGTDDAEYDLIATNLRQTVGRLINDKMPTGVAVSPAMNHGGPYPATGHPGFTSVGVPGSLVRFAMLQCFDNVRPHRLPEVLQDKNPGGVWRQVDGAWSQGDV